MQALLIAGANPRVRDNNGDTPLHFACRLGDLEAVQTLFGARRLGPESLAARNDRLESPIRCLLHVAPGQEAAAGAIRRFLAVPYAGVLAQRHGLGCVHAVLQSATFDDNGGEFLVRGFGSIHSAQMQNLLGRLMAAEPGSVHALDRNGLLPVQVASQLNFPVPVIYLLLRPYPGYLL